ncbi:MAG TPA: amino acid permease [Candidatus Methanoperedens sp.]
MFKDLLIRKPMDQLMKEAANNRELKRVLGPLNLTTLGIGAIIGAGIFVLTGQAAAQYAGPAIVFSFIFSGFGAAMAALCYAEFASTVPISGSAYTYSYATLGELFAWIIGWDLMLEYLFGASTVAVGWSGYVVSFLEDFGINIPSYLSSAPLTQDPVLGWHTTGAFLNLPAMFIVAVMTVLLVIGIKESAVFNNIIVLVKISVLILFITFGIAYIKTGNWVPFIPPNTGEFGHFGLSGILRGAGVIFFAYFGFDAVSTAAQEARNPKKDMPIGIISSLAISTVLYITVSLVLTGLVKYDQLLVPDPIAVAVNAAGPGLFWLRPFVKIGAIAGLSSVVLVLLLSQPRIFYTMAKDGLLPKRFASIHPKFKTPYVTTILTGTIAMFVSGLFPIEILGALVSIGTLLAFAIVSASVIVLRRTQPDLPRPFKTPFVPWVPIFGMLFSFAQMIALPVDTWLRLLIWMAIGLMIYFSYGRKHSKVRRCATL